jgi:polygalacturonase
MYSNPDAVKKPTFPDRTCPVSAGANSAAINAAIAMCSSMGGGVVTFAPGNYTVGSIHLQSNVKLALNGASLRGNGTDGAEPYTSPIACQDEGHRHWHNAMIWGENVTNVAIIGPGTLNGGGLDNNNQKMIALKSSSVLQFEDLTQSGTGHFGYLLTDCHDITMAKLTMHPSRDGVDLMQCSNVYAHDLNITGGGDDSFALKSDCTLNKRIVSDNITVANSTLGSGANALQFGSETWGDFQNITWANIKVVRGGKSGIGLQMNDGANIKNVLFENITLSGTSFPIFISSTSLLRGPTKMPGHAENIRFRNITANGIVAGNNKSPQETAIIISGQVDNPHQGIVLEHVTINFPGGGKTSGDPPEGHTLKGGVAYNPRYITPIPAWGLFSRHVKGLELTDVKFTFGNSDGRPSVIARDVDGLRLDAFSAAKGGGPTLELEGIKNLTVKGSAPLADTTMATVDKATF